VLGLNKVMLMGEVGEKAELRYTPDGTAVACFTIGVSHATATSSGKLQRGTDWFSVVTWRELAERCEEELEPGVAVYVEGRLRNHIWRDALGRQMVRTEVIAEKLVVLTADDGAYAEKYTDYEYQWRD